MHTHPAAVRRLQAAGYVPPRQRQRCCGCARVEIRTYGDSAIVHHCTTHAAPVSAQGWCPKFDAAKAAAATTTREESTS